MFKPTETNYYLYSFQIHNDNEKLIEANAKLEGNKIIFEFKIDDKTKERIMQEFAKLG